MVMNSINLSTDLVSRKSLLTDAEEMLGGNSSLVTSQNMSMMSDVGSSVGSMKGIENSAMDSMQNLATDGIEMCTNVAMSCKEIASDLYSSSPLSGSVSNIKNQCSKGIDSVKSFANTLNPANGFTAIAALVKFLMCPEASLLGDLTNTFNSVVRGANNLNPSNLLNGALQNLTSSVLGRAPPTLNTMMNFFSLLNQYFNTKQGSMNKNATLESIARLLNSHGKDMSYISNANIFSNIKDLLSPSNTIYNNMKVTTPLPVVTITQYCSNLAKIIAQMQASYRSNNVYDDVVTNRITVANISDPAVASEVDRLTGMTPSANQYINASNSATDLGYHGETAINSSLVASIENAKYLELIDKEFTEAGNDPAKLEIARINSIEYTNYLTELNNTTSTKLVAFSKGIDNIRRESDYYNISETIEKVS